MTLSEVDRACEAFVTFMEGIITSGLSAGDFLHESTKQLNNNKMK